MTKSGAMTRYVDGIRVAPMPEPFELGLGLFEPTVSRPTIVAAHISRLMRQGVSPESAKAIATALVLSLAGRCNLAPQRQQSLGVRAA